MNGWTGQRQISTVLSLVSRRVTLCDIFLAFFPAFEMPNGYLGLVKSVGETIEFGVAEQ